MLDEHVAPVAHLVCDAVESTDEWERPGRSIQHGREIDRKKRRPRRRSIIEGIDTGRPSNDTSTTPRYRHSREIAYSFTAGCDATISSDTNDHTSRHTFAPKRRLTPRHTCTRIYSSSNTHLVYVCSLATSWVYPWTELIAGPTRWLDTIARHHRFHASVRSTVSKVAERAPRFSATDLPETIKLSPTCVPNRGEPSGHVCVSLECKWAVCMRRWLLSFTKSVFDVGRCWWNLDDTGGSYVCRSWEERSYYVENVLPIVFDRISRCWNIRYKYSVVRRASQ